MPNALPDGHSGDPMGICTALPKMVGQVQNVVKSFHSAGFHRFNSDPPQYFIISISINCNILVG